MTALDDATQTAVPRADEGKSTDAPPGPRARILVCDDNEDIVEMLASVLELEGFDPVSVYCGADALDVIQHRSVDLVLLDKAMPDIDGFEVCRQIKQLFPLRFLPVILVTAKAHREDKLAGLNLGADDYITKPFDIEEVLAKVRVMLRIKGVEDQLFQRNMELASFNAVAGVVGESLVLEEMLHNSVTEILRLMDLPCGAIYLHNEHSTGANLAVYVGPQGSGAVSALECISTSPVTRHSCDWLDDAFRQRHNLHSCVAIPLKSKGRILGCMTLASREREKFQRRSSDLQVLESLGYELGVAVEHALLYRDAQRTVEQLRDLDQIKSQFISTASHEFRTPLSIIKGFTNLLTRKEAFGFDLATEKEYLTLIDGQIMALTSLVEDMLDASRIESGHVDRTPRTLDLGASLATTVTPIALQARERGITVAVEAAPGLQVTCDSNHLEQIISNLLTNAVKYSDDGTHVTVRAYHDDAMVRLDVSDEGVGIDPDDMTRLFERFTRIENRRSVAAGGTGLGLYIVKNWVEAAGGRIWAQSTPGRGSTFSVTLPASCEMAAR